MCPRSWRRCRTSGKKLAIVASRTAQPFYRNLLLGKLGVELVVCKTDSEKNIAPMLDACHVNKRQQEAMSTGTHLLVFGPQHYVSIGFWGACGVRADVIDKPDPMSDQLIGC